MFTFFGYLLTGLSLFLGYVELKYNRLWRTSYGRQRLVRRLAVSVILFALGVLCWLTSGALARQDVAALVAIWTYGMPLLLAMVALAMLDAWATYRLFLARRSMLKHLAAAGYAPPGVQHPPANEAEPTQPES